MSKKYNALLIRLGELLDNIEYEGYTLEDTVKELNDILSVGDDWEEDYPASFDDVSFDDL